LRNVNQSHWLCQVLGFGEGFNVVIRVKVSHLKDVFVVVEHCGVLVAAEDLSWKELGDKAVFCWVRDCGDLECVGMLGLSKLGA